MRYVFLFFFSCLFLSLPSASKAAETYRVIGSHETVAFSLKQHEQGVDVAWICPGTLSEQFDQLSSDKERSAFCRAELQKQADAGDTWNECRLGYLDLYGIGVEQDLAEAERRFRIDFEDFRRLNKEDGIDGDFVFGNEPERFFDPAAELVLASLASGKERTADLAIHISYFTSASEDPQTLEMAQRLLDAVAEYFPDRGYALCKRAEVRFKRGLVDEAWSMASAVLEMPEVTPKSVDRIGSLRRRIAYTFAVGDEPDYEKAQGMFDTIVADSPEDDYSLYMSADMRFDRGLYDEAWDRASALLELPNISQRSALGAHSIRLQAARELGCEDQLVSADLTVPLKALFDKSLPKGFKLGLLILLLVMSIFPLCLLVWLTRRKADRGPGVVLMGCWLFMYIVAGCALLLESKLMMVGVLGGAATSLLLALYSTRRRLYFPRISLQLNRKRVRFFCKICLWYGLLILIGALYEWLYSIVFGHPPERQMVAIFLQGNGLVAKACVMICVALLVPVMEEVIFRGFLIDCLRRKLSWGWSILLSALIFGILHGTTAFIPIAVMGGIAGYLRFRYKQMWAPIFLHCLNNVVCVLVMWFEVAS